MCSVERVCFNANEFNLVSDSDSDGKLEIVTDEENQTGASNENIASVANAANPKVDAEGENSCIDVFI